MNSSIDYHLTIQTLRKLLRSFNTLDPTDINTATILIDLRKALGFDPMVTPAVTARQREVIMRHLIEDRPADEAAQLLGLGIDSRKAKKQTGPKKKRRRWGGRRQMLLVERTGLLNILAYLKGERSEARSRLWRPWQIALLYDARLSLSELATKIGKSELAVKLMISKLRKRHESIPSRRRVGRRAAS